MHKLSLVLSSYETKRLELEKWLARMEAHAERMGSVATTADVLEAQQKEQKVSSRPAVRFYHFQTFKHVLRFPTGFPRRIASK